MLVKNQNGILSTEYKDYSAPGVQSLTAAQFERGDVTSFVPDPQLRFHSQIHKGDTIGVIKSNEWLQRIAELDGSLKIARATLEVFQTGEVESMIKEAKHQLEFASAEAANQKRIFERISDLFKEDLVSDEEYEFHKTQLALLDINVTIAEAQLETVSKGSKPAQIQLIRTEVESLQDQLDIYKERVHSSVLISPIDGELIGSYSVDTLYMVYDQSELIAVMPVSWPAAKHIEIGDSVDFAGAQNNVRGVVVNKDNIIRSIGGRQSMVATISLPDDSGILSGQTVQGKVICDPIPLRSHVVRFFQ
jgi:multidrug efflux pump subunit AcrA (membrane-fusion protein)